MKYGNLPKIGVGAIVPSVNKVFEYEWHWAFRGEIPLYVSRAEYDFSHKDPLQYLLDDSMQAAIRLSQLDLPIYIFACTGASFYHGVKGNIDLIVELSKIVKSKVITASSAVVTALKAMEIHKVSLITPYVKEDNQREILFLQANGFEVVSDAGMNIADAKYESQVSYEDGYAFIKDHVDENADGVLLSCTNWHTWPLVDILEKEFGLPFITSNSALAFSTIKEVYEALDDQVKEKIRKRKLGKLFREL